MVEIDIFLDYCLVTFSFIGLYYIDPNEGSKADAVLVFCRISERLTCVNSTNPIIQIDRWHLARSYYGQPIKVMRELSPGSEVKLRMI